MTHILTTLAVGIIMMGTIVFCAIYIGPIVIDIMAGVLPKP